MVQSFREALTADAFLKAIVIKLTIRIRICHYPLSFFFQQASCKNEITSRHVVFYQDKRIDFMENNGTSLGKFIVPLWGGGGGIPATSCKMGFWNWLF